MRIPLLAACCLVMAGCAEIHVTERHFIRPDKAGSVIEKHAIEGTTDIEVAATGGAMLRGVLLEQPGARSAILYFGGNMFHLDRHGSEVMPVLSRCGANLAVFDYRGYGRSSGVPTVANMQADALALFDALDARFPGRVIVHGQSLGSFMAAHVAQSRPVLAAVLETTATSAQELVESNIPWYAAPFVRIDLEASLREVDNRSAATRFRAPTLVIVAGQDRMTPPRLGKKVFAAIPRTDKQLLLLESATHDGALRGEEAGAAYCKFVRGVAT